MAEARADDPPDRRTPWGLYLALTLAVWGLFVLDRGLWHDDVQNLFRAFVAPERGEGFFPAITMPTRRLLGVPYFLALESGPALQVLQLFAGLAWLFTGVLAERLARRLWPAAPLAGLVAGVLTLTATPDFFTNTLVGLSYQLSILAYLAALLLGLRWLQGGGPLLLALSSLCLAASLWTTDVALPVWALAPVLWASAPGASRRRALSLALVWYATPLPYLYVLLGQVAGSGGYLQRAVVPLDAHAWSTRFGSLLVHNFTPWRWAFARPLWFPRLEELVPFGVRLLVAGLGAGLAWHVARRSAHEPAPQELDRRGAPVLALLLLMAASNALFVSVQLSDLFCRTHLLSRVFASLALAGLGAMAFHRAQGAGRRVLAAAFAAWVTLGLLGGLERQDYFAAYWRAHRQELGSILAQVPSLAPDAHLLLHVPAHERYLATEAGYLARAWLSLLYQDSSVECRVFLWSDARPTACAAQPDAYECRGERSPDCQRLDGLESERLAYDKLVLLEYEPSRNEYVLRPQLPPDAGSGSGGYRPGELVRVRPRAPLGRALLESPGGLAARLWP